MHHFSRAGRNFIRKSNREGIFKNVYLKYTDNQQDMVLKKKVKNKGIVYFIFKTLTQIMNNFKNPSEEHTWIALEEASWVIRTIEFMFQIGFWHDISDIKKF